MEVMSQNYEGAKVPVVLAACVSRRRHDSSMLSFVFCSRELSVYFTSATTTSLI